MMYTVTGSQPSGDPHGRILSLIPKIQSGDARATVELQAILGPGLLWFFRRHLESNLGEDLQQVLVPVIEKIKKGAILDSKSVIGYARTLAHSLLLGRPRNKQYQHSADQVPSRNSEHSFIWRGKVEAMKQMLSEMTDRQQEILLRFYVDKQTQVRICREMHLSKTEFKQLKVTARARFDELVRGKHLIATTQ